MGKDSSFGVLAGFALIILVGVIVGINLLFQFWNPIDPADCPVVEKCLPAVCTTTSERIVYATTTLECGPEYIPFEDTEKIGSLELALKDCRDSQGGERTDLLNKLGECENNLKIKEAERNYWELEADNIRNKLNECINK